jgi:hypothetical protein
VVNADPGGECNKIEGSSEQLPQEFRSVGVGGATAIKGNRVGCTRGCAGQLLSSLRQPRLPSASPLCDLRPAWWHNAAANGRRSRGCLRFAGGETQRRRGVADCRSELKTAGLRWRRRRFALSRASRGRRPRSMQDLRFRQGGIGRLTRFRSRGARAKTTCDPASLRSRDRVLRFGMAVARDIRAVIAMHLEPLSQDRRPGTTRHAPDELRCDDPPGTRASD